MNAPRTPLSTTSRTPHPLLGVLLASAIVLSARSARADDTPRIFPLIPSSPLPAAQAGAPAALTDALVALLEGVTTDRSLDEFGKKLRCDIEVSACLDAVARSLVTGQLVYGTITAAPGSKLKVKLVRFDSAKTGSAMHQRTFTLTAQTPKRLGKQLARLAAEMFDRQPAVDVDEPEPTPPPTRDIETIDVTEPDPDPDPAPPEDAPAAGRITGSTWGILGGGAVGVAAGAGFLFSARGLRGTLEAAPRETVDDFRRLTAIERAGRIRTQVGGALLVTGGAALAVGAVRAILQRRGGGGGGGGSESLERSVALMPIEGGAAIVFSGGLR